MPVPCDTRVRACVRTAGKCEHYAHRAKETQQNEQSDTQKRIARMASVGNSSVPYAPLPREQAPSRAMVYTPVTVHKQLWIFVLILDGQLGLDHFRVVRMHVRVLPPLRSRIQR